MEKNIFRLFSLIILSLFGLSSCDDSASIFNLQDLANVCVMASCFFILKLIVGILGYRTPSYRARKKVEETESAAQNELGKELWAIFHEKLNNAKSYQDIDKIVQDFIDQNNISYKEVQVLMNYIKAIKYQQSVKEGNYKDEDENNERNNNQFYHYYYQKGYNLQTEEERRNAQLLYETKRNAALEVDPDADIYTDIETYELVANGATETQKKAMQDYIAAKAVHDGILFRNKVENIKKKTSD